MNAAVLTFTDNFNRTDVATTTSGTALGNANYVVTSANNDAATGVQITGNRAAGPGVAGPSFIALSYQGFALKPEFTLTTVLIATSTLAAGQQWGVVWNFQDNNDFYWARFRNTTQLQVGKMVNGVATATDYNLGGTAVSNTSYTMSISSTANYTFNFSLVGGSINLSNTYTDAGSSFTGGYGGALWATPHAHLRVDSLSITTVPEPGTMLLLGLGVFPLVCMRKRAAKRNI